MPKAKFREEETWKRACLEHTPMAGKLTIDFKRKRSSSMLGLPSQRKRQLMSCGGRASTEFTMFDEDKQHARMI
jgi:hypothetical protein